MNLTPYLEDLEVRIDEAEEARLWDQWRQFCRDECPDEVFSPRRAQRRPARVEWPKVLVNEALDDMDKMVLQQLAGCSALLDKADGHLLAVRCNYGTPIMPSLWGARLAPMDDALDCLPASHPLGRDCMPALADAGPVDVSEGLGGKTFRMAEHFRRVMAPYPKVSRWVRLYHPDIQGPMDICEMLWGSEIFYDLVDQPQLVHRVLEVVTRTYSAFMRRWLDEVGPSGHEPELSVHWGMLHKGTLMLRDDSAMNLSPEMFDAFIRPYDERLLVEFGGGVIHACGRVEHYTDRLADMPGLAAFNMSQPDLNNMDDVYAHTVDRGIPLINFSALYAREALDAGRPLRGRVHSSDTSDIYTGRKKA